MHPFATIVDVLNAAAKKQQLVFVGLSGLGNSGKTYTCNRLKEAIPGLSVIHVDDFYKPSDDRESSHASDDLISSCFDWDRLESCVFEPIKRGDSMLKYDIYDWDRNVINRCTALPLKGIVVLEGIYAFQTRFMDAYDLTIWVDTPLEGRDVRAQKRYSQEFLHHWNTVWKSQDQRYIERDAPDKQADFVLYNY